MDYVVTTATDDDLDQIAALESTLIDAGPRQSRRYLRWKYWENPLITSPLIFVVRLGREIVGMRGMYGTSWTLGPGYDPTVFPHADDLVIDPDHRNRGLFLLIHRAMVAEARQRGFGAILSLSGVTATQELSLVCGYRALGDLDGLHRPTTTNPSVLRRGEGRIMRTVRTRGGWSPAFAWGTTVNGFCRRLASSSHDGHIEISATADLASMSSLAARVEPERLRADRGEAFLRWRLANPDHIYRFVYWRDTVLRGYLVLSWDVMRPHRVTIAEIAADADDVVADLVGALGHPTDREYTIMSATLSDAQERIIRSAGFVVDPETTNEARRQFLYLPLTQDSPFEPPSDDAEFRSRWSVSSLDIMTA